MASQMPRHEHIVYSSHSYEDQPAVAVLPGPFSRQDRRGSLARLVRTTTLSLQQTSSPMIDPVWMKWKNTENNSCSMGGRRRSSSCSALDPSFTSHAAMGGFDGHRLYKIKKSQSDKKLAHFFGQDLDTLDVSIREIECQGLKALLLSRIPICYFLRLLLAELCSENLFFFTELEQYESFEYLCLAQQLAAARHIYDTYIKPNGHFEVNLDEKIRRTVYHAIHIAKQPNDCFRPAKEAVYQLLESSFMRFIHHGVWHDMVAQCNSDGEQPGYYSERVRQAAVTSLLDQMDQFHSMLYTNPHTDSPFFMAKKRHELTRAMVGEFCRTVARVEVEVKIKYTAAQATLVKSQSMFSTTAPGKPELFLKSFKRPHQQLVGYLLPKQEKKPPALL